MRLYRNIDWARTVRSNLRGWDPERRRLVAERFYFWANQRRAGEWDLAILVDQSASMAESVVMSAVMAAIFASLRVLRTRLLLFNTDVVDMTSHLTDPVGLLFSAQLGGGTNIGRAVAYAQEHFIERPQRTLFILISDLYEGGKEGALLARMRHLVESRVRVLVLLSLSDREAAPQYDRQMARALAELGVPCFACTPRRLCDVIEQVLSNREPVLVDDSAAQLR
jgi:Mg-chelatase subunit ChlD